MSTSKTCPHCGNAVSESALMGLCPDCLLRAGMPTGGDGTRTAESKAPFEPPTPAELAPRFPQLEIIELLGRGGMGAVYKARQKHLDRLVALKVLPPRAAEDPSFAGRFEHEAKALAKLNHPNIVTLYESGQADGLFYFLMEFVDGVTLRQLLSTGRITPREALAIVPPICDALQFAHDRGIVHRDIKPENVLLGKDGQVKIADFGVAKIVGRDGGASAGTASAMAAGPALTADGGVLGTPQYMAPEQRSHPADVDHRADIYSLGVVFYQMLTGELPAGKFEPPSHRVQIDVRLDDVVLRALEREPERRYQHASEVRTAVQTIAASPGTAGPEPAAPAATRAPAFGSARLSHVVMPLILALAAAALVGTGFSDIVQVNTSQTSAAFHLSFFGGHTWTVSGVPGKAPLGLRALPVVFVVGAAVLGALAGLGISALIRLRRSQTPPNQPAAGTAAAEPAPARARREEDVSATLWAVGWHAVLLLLFVAFAALVLPRSTRPLTDLQVALPPVTVVAIALEGLLARFWLVLVPVLLGLDVGVCYLLRCTGSRRLTYGWSIAVTATLGLLALGMAMATLLPYRVIVANLWPARSSGRADSVPRRQPEATDAAGSLLGGGVGRSAGGDLTGGGMGRSAGGDLTGGGMAMPDRMPGSVPGQPPPGAAQPGRTSKPGRFAPGMPASVLVARHEVNRQIADFPAALDLSTPESACAAFHRAGARGDVRASSQLSWVPLDVAATEAWLHQESAMDPQAMAAYLKAVAGATVVEVLSWGADLAETIARLPLPAGLDARPYSARTFGRIDGQWKNLGEERLPTLEAARASFEERKEALWQQYQHLAEKLAPKVLAPPGG